jgi:hypothetical protein
MTRVVAYHLELPSKNKVAMDVVAEMARSRSTALDAVAEAFLDKSQYSSRPMVDLTPKQFEADLAMWLLGRRTGEATAIHGRGPSAAAVRVLRGAIHERVFDLEYRKAATTMATVTTRIHREFGLDCSWPFSPPWTN